MIFQNGFIACVPPTEKDKAKTKQSSLATLPNALKNKTLVKLIVKYGNGHFPQGTTYLNGSSVYVKAESLSFPWAKEIYSIDVDGAPGGKEEMVLVPITEIVASAQ